MSPTVFKSQIPGLLLVFALAGAAIFVSALPAAQSAGLSALTLSIMGGMVIGNTIYRPFGRWCNDGVVLSKQSLLRIGIILFGFRLTLHDIQAVGVAAVVIDALVLGSTFLLACYLGVRWFNLDRVSVMLIGAGSSICGAAAVLATGPVVKGNAEQVSVAVATVVVFGTLAMFLDPWLFGPLHAWTGMSDFQYGLFVGSTVHEVAQVVVAGHGVSDAAANVAVIVKMIRVMMLAPFLLLLSWWLSHNASPEEGDRRRSVVVPWFALWFVAVIGFNSLAWLPDNWVSDVIRLDNLLLAMAMCALGLTTRLAAIRQAGIRPLLLAGGLFIYLTGGGVLINGVIVRIFG